jgi:hypothetical protein
MWAWHARARCIEFESGGDVQRFVGEHYGYERLADPVVHRREITLDARRQRIEVTDILRCEGTHVARRSWHFAEDCQVERAGQGLKATSGLTQMWLEPLEDLSEAHLFVGGTAEQGGWVSRQFGRKQPAPTARWHNQVHGQTTLRTRITWTRSRGTGI